MRRRHRVHSISVSKSGKAIMVHTKGGSVGFAFNDRLLSKLEYYFPHLTHLFESTVELNELLVGRYIYGKTEEVMLGDTIVKRLT